MSFQFSAFSLPERLQSFSWAGFQKKTKPAFGPLKAESYQLTAGFTLVELLVVCAIIIVVSAVVFANNNRFGGQVLLQNATYDIALSLREAQVYGISVQRFGSGSSSLFNTGYGIHFDSRASQKQNQSYLLFADLEKSGAYDSSYSSPEGATESVASTNISRGYFIYKLCVPAGSDIASCSPVSTLDIVYVRPEPDAYISYSIAGDGSTQSFDCSPASCPSPQSDARIVLTSPRGDMMSVIVYANGQISVDQNVTAATPAP